MKLLMKFIRNEEGATAIEYGLIAALIGVAIIGGATTLGTSINDTLDSVAGSLTPAE
jgi:pilus assembly protein Flp/PilA